MDRSGDTGEQLQRALGFVDMVAFTNRSNELGAADLVKLIEVFEHTCRDVISANGARVVKTIGDAFLYIADDLVTGADTATEIVERLRNEPYSNRKRGAWVDRSTAPKLSAEGIENASGARLGSVSDSIMRRGSQEFVQADADRRDEH